MNLFFRKSGQGRPLIILHGLFGSSDNWYTLAKTFSEHFTVYLVDQRNHGQSPKSDAFNYRLLAEDLDEFIRQNGLADPVILGHSMGGKTAMNFAVAHPTLLSRLIVVDIIPKAYPVHHDAILDGLKSINLEKLTSRTEADQLLVPYVPEAKVRQFLLKNLSRSTGGGFEWKINLSAIDRNIEAMGEDLIYSGKYEGEALFIMGKKSNYYREGDQARVKQIFPRAEIKWMDTGHWVQAEKPAEFAQLVLDYLR